MSSEYFAKWYAENKEKLSQRRRDRYQNDPAYKAKVLSNSKRSRKLARPSTDTIENGSGRVVGKDGVERNCYTVNETAFMLNVSRETLVAWERLGLMPTDPFGGSRRRYTAGQIQGIKKAIEAHKNGTKRVHVRKDNIGFRAMIDEHWNSLPEVSGLV